jgi:endonuclease YncB( thermonuclease family)
VSSERQGWLVRHPLLSAVLVIVVVVWAASRLGITDAADPEAHTTDRAGAHRGDDRTSPKQKSRTKAAPKQEHGSSAASTYVVAHVVDGDTVDLGNGETVRLVGIDTPEIGECGYERATAKLTELVGGQLVTLGESDEDRDKYGRLLRYVDRGQVDAGLEMIRSGLAIARYDSRDGYGRHPREDLYVEADQKSADVRCAPPPQHFVDAPSGCEPGYSPCVPTYPPDVDCADTGPVTVTGPDPHGLDADNDGFACGGD